MVRQMKNGGKYYYQFIKDGQRYNGVCEGCTTKREAEAFEKKVRDIGKDFAETKSVDRLFERRRQELAGHKIPLEKAFDLSLQKPRSRTLSMQQERVKRSVFADFVAFMKATHSDIQDLAAVTAIHAEEYISLIRQSGKFLKVSIYTRNGKTISAPLIKQTVINENGEETKTAVSVIPSSRTANLYQSVCAEVFRLLARDAGISENPFAAMPKLKKTEETREAFTLEEIQTIHDNLDDFTRPLFTVAIMTALREGDICTLRWNDLNFKDRVIRKVMNKTGNIVEIPMAEALYKFFSEQWTRSGTDEYVFPDHAKMYLENKSGVSYRVKQFLERIGIQTTRIPKGRSRAVSVKDLHSCRHTFCYFAGMRGIPLAVVQSIVGHMTPEMTKHYSAHATLEDKQRYMLNMADFISDDAPITGTGITGSAPGPRKALNTGPCINSPDDHSNASEAPERLKLRTLAETLPIEKIKELLKFAKGLEK